MGRGRRYVRWEGARYVCYAVLDGMLSHTSAQFSRKLLDIHTVLIKFKRSFYKAFKCLIALTKSLEVKCAVTSF